MPVVPTSNGPQVKDQALPSVRIGASAPDELFGLGASDQNLNQAKQGISNQVTSYFEKQKKMADEVAILDADQRLSALETKLLYDKDTGALNKRGKDAFGVPDEVNEGYTTGADEIEKTLSNDEQKMAFRRAKASRWSDINRTTQKFVSAEARQYDEQVTTSFMNNEQDAAAANYQDPERVAMSIERQRAAVQQHAERNGLPPEYVKMQMVEATSKTHSLVVSRYLNSNLPDADTRAKSYYEAVKETVSGKDQMAIEKSLEEATLRGESQRTSDQIIRTKPNQVDALEEARKIQDPKLRDETERRVLNYYGQRKAAENALREDLYTEAAKIVDNNPGSESDVRLKISPETWTKLSPEQQKALENRAGDPANNDKKWLEFLDTGASIGNLSRAEFETKYWSHFDRAHRTRAEAMWESSQKKGGDSANLTQALSFKDRVENTLKVGKIIPADKSLSQLDAEDSKKYAKFETVAAHALEDFEKNELQGKRKATGDEVQKIIDKVTINQVFTTRNWFFADKPVPASLVSEDQKGNVYVPAEKIPTSEKNSIENLLRSKQKRIDQKKIERAYGAYLMGDKNLFNQIVSE